MVLDGVEGRIQVTLVAAEPAPPDVGDNVWELILSDLSDGSDLDGCTVQPEPYMPDHGHGATAGEASAGTDPGSYVLEQGFPMAGYWQITLQLDCPPVGEDRVVFDFCLEG
jgi:hypothetical protein